MKRTLFTSIMALFLLSSTCNAFDLEKTIKEVEEKLGKGSKKGVDDKTRISGLKEALSVGTEKAVKAVSQTDGYFGNAKIKIPVPEEIRSLTDTL